MSNLIVCIKLKINQIKKLKMKQHSYSVQSVSKFPISELSYSEMGNSEFLVTEQLNCVSLLNSK